eukprot:scaffold191042_cov17-Tisochrysis_lutea.AAC.1
MLLLEYTIFEIPAQKKAIENDGRGGVVYVTKLCISSQVGACRRQANGQGQRLFICSATKRDSLMVSKGMMYICYHGAWKLPSVGHARTAQVLQTNGWHMMARLQAPELLTHS